MNPPIEQLPTTRAFSLWLCRRLLRLRPSQVGEWTKRALRIKRRFVRTTNQQVLWVDPASQFGVDVMGAGIYEVKMTRLLETLLREDDTFVDVGANEGYFSVVAAKISPKGQVHAIEPQSRLHRVIQENARANEIKNLVLHRLALAEKPGTMKLYLRPDTNTGASSFFPKWRVGRTFEEIPVTTLDRFFEESKISKTRLLKIDCEGAEALIFPGARGILRERVIEFIALEYHPTICGEQACVDIDKMLRDSGYALTSADGHWIYHLPHLRSELSPLGKLSDVPPWKT